MKVMNNTDKLKNEKNIFVNHQQPEAIKEKDKKLRFQRRYQRELYKDENIDIRIKKGHVHVGNQVIRDRVCTPSIQMMLSTTPDERKDVCRMKLSQSERVRDGGSVFQGYACHVSSYDDVQRAYTKIKLENPSSADVMCSFTVKDGYYGNKQQIELDDDKEHGSVSRIYTAIQQCKLENVAVFVVRYFDGSHIGHKRFEHIKTVASKALALLA